MAAAVDICAPPARDKVEPLSGPDPVIPLDDADGFEVAAAFEAEAKELAVAAASAAAFATACLFYSSNLATLSCSRRSSSILAYARSLPSISYLFASFSSSISFSRSSE